MKLHHFKKVLGGGGRDMPPNPLAKHITPNLKTIRAPPATCWLPWLVGYAPVYTKRIPII